MEHDFSEFCSVVYNEFKKLIQVDGDIKDQWAWFTIGMIVGSCEEKGIAWTDEALKVASDIFETHL